MSEAKHTAGEWYVTGSRDINGKYLHIASSKSNMILASLNPVHVDTEANALLFAAAPDLLAACEQMACDSRMISGEPLLLQLRAAIAKATAGAA